jgi:hypothetical protein
METSEKERPASKTDHQSWSCERWRSKLGPETTWSNWIGFI